jgi:hypothetical protein
MDIIHRPFFFKTTFRRLDSCLRGVRRRILTLSMGSNEFHLKIETESSLRNVVSFKNKNIMMDNVQKTPSCILRKLTIVLGVRISQTL